ncbi:MAG: Asp-tRNA(Asn)/Glu-tRNA(Gln) amidotransferase subunit GatC [Deltaproteobacteria bacterium]|jgi:aspartyl-tRNA(Asn)/glutamyl-tRNA(Gln) amidotransferase subunit C|nr:Asp-tRNA(Asn)/Glu-tRNA(Gln) amidotransferase subunit GatC [Deltaproteobacteria bacterium]
MTIDETTARTVANLARLELAQEVGEERLQALVEEFSKIVGYMDILSEAQTEGVEPLYSPMIDPQLPRSDNPVLDSQKADDILSQAPERVGRYFSVPRIF